MAEWSKALDLGSSLHWHGFKSHRPHCFDFCKIAFSFHFASFFLPTWKHTAKLHICNEARISHLMCSFTLSMIEIEAAVSNIQNRLNAA